MSTGISEFGIIGCSGVFGWESNEPHLRVYLRDPANQLLPLLQKLFGDGGSTDPMQFPDDWGINGFYAYSATYDTADPHGTQGETESEGDFSLLDAMPTIRGGINIDITFRPMDDTQQGGGISLVTDENWDFSVQVMSMIGNNYATANKPNNTQSLTWASDNAAVTNLTSILKFIPKIEFVQRRTWCLSLPSQTQRNLIGQINDGVINIGPASGSLACPEGTALLLGLPMIRRWRFDGVPIYEVGIKFAINTYQDVIDATNGATDYVTWNRLYRHTQGYWDKIQIGPNKKTLYLENDLSQVTGGF